MLDKLVCAALQVQCLVRCLFACILKTYLQAHLAGDDIGAPDEDVRLKVLWFRFTDCD
jgi:hypothetical protein